MQDVLKKYFQFDEYETTFKKEIIAGTTNFLTNLSKKSPTSTSGRWIAFLFDFY